MKRLINWILVKLGLKKPPKKWEGRILRIEDWQDESEEWNSIGWKFYGGYGVISTGNVDVERSKENEQT